MNLTMVGGYNGFRTIKFEISTTKSTAFSLSLQHSNGSLSAILSRSAVSETSCNY